MFSFSDRYVRPPSHIPFAGEEFSRWSAVPDLWFSTTQNMIPYDFWMQQESSNRSPFSHHDRLSQWFQSPMFEHRRAARNPTRSPVSFDSPSSSSSSSSSVPFAGRRNLMSSGRQIFQSPLAVWFDRFVRDDQSGGGLWEVEHLSDSATHRRNRKVVHWWVDPTRLSNLMSQHQRQMQQQQLQEQRFRGGNGLEVEEEEEEGPVVPNVRVFRRSRPGMAFPSKQAMENRAWQLLREYLQEIHNDEEEQQQQEEEHQGQQERPLFPTDGENGEDGGEEEDDDEEDEEATEQFMKILGQFVYAGSQEQLSQLLRNQQQQQQNVPHLQRREATEFAPRAPEAVQDLLRERRDIVGYCVEGTLSPQGDSSQWKVVLINL